MYIFFTDIFPNLKPLLQMYLSFQTVKRNLEGMQLISHAFSFLLMRYLSHIIENNDLNLDALA